MRITRLEHGDLVQVGPRKGASLRRSTAKIGGLRVGEEHGLGPVSLVLHPAGSFRCPGRACGNNFRPLALFKCP